MTHDARFHATWFANIDPARMVHEPQAMVRGPCSMNRVRSWSDLGPTLVHRWLDLGALFGRPWFDFGPTLVQHWFDLCTLVPTVCTRDSYLSPTRIPKRVSSMWQYAYEFVPE